MTKLVRMRLATYKKLNKLAKDKGISMQRILDEAIENYKREKLLEDANKAYAELQADPVAWQEELAERALWETTSADGLDDEV